MTDTDVPRHDPVSLGKNSPPVSTGLRVRPGVVCAVGRTVGRRSRPLLASEIEKHPSLVFKKF